MAIAFPGFDRITADPALLGGKPVIRGMRLSVQRMLEILALNPSWDALRFDYPELEPEDIRQALAFAAANLGDRGLSGPPFPEALDRRLHTLLDKQDLGERLSEDEQAEAEALVDLAQLLTLLRLRVSPPEHPATG